MNALVDRLSAETSDMYVHYMETFLVDLMSEKSSIEFRCGFPLRRDHELRRFTLKVPIMAWETDGERDLLIVVIFEQIEELIDKAITEHKVLAN